VAGRGRKNQTNANETKLKKNSNQYKAIPTPTTNYFSLLSSEENTDNIQTILQHPRVEI
jgi:hypothetical protein